MTKKPTVPLTEEQLALTKLSPVLRALTEHPKGLEAATIWGADSSPKGAKFVDGEGPAPSDLMIIGEAPGAEEDSQGRPFVGASGKLLMRCLEEAGLRREEIYVTNARHFRPPENRVPTDAEIAQDAPYLVHEILKVKPKVIVPLGNVPLKALLKKSGITKVRGTIFMLEEFECKVIPAYHPSYLLHNAGDEVLHGHLVSDLKMARAVSRGEDPVMGDKPRRPTDYKVIENKEQFDGLIDELLKSEVVEFDLETTGFDLDIRKIIFFAFSNHEGSGRVVPLYTRKNPDSELEPFWGELHNYVRERLKEFFESEVPKCAHMGSFDIPFIKTELGTGGLGVNKYAYDTLVMHRLLDENAKTNGLKPLALKFTDMGAYDTELDMWKTRIVEKYGPTPDATLGEQLMSDGPVVDFSRIPYEVLWKYAAADVDATGRLRRLFCKMIEEQGMIHLFRRIIVPMQSALCKMEWRGIKIDRQRLKEIRDEYHAVASDIDRQLQAHSVTEQAKKILGLEEINYGSSTQLRVILFDILGLKPIKKTKPSQKHPHGVNSTDEKVLAILGRDHEIPKMITEYRSHLHLVEAYGENFEAFIRKDGRIHSKFGLIATEVHRLSSRNPNLQNIHRLESDALTGQVAIGSRARRIFVAEEGHSLVEADFNQIQYRLWANYSKDPQLLDDIINGRDPHRINASVIFGIPAEKITLEQRQQAKTFVYAVIMGVSAWKLSKEFGVPEYTAQEWIDKFSARYPGTKNYERRMIQMARDKGYVTDLFGGRRRLPDIISAEPKMRGHAERCAVNAPIQRLEAHIMFISFVRIDMAFEKECPQAHPVLTVHDSVISEAPDELVPEVTEIMKREMARPIPGVEVPLGVEIKVGKDLFSMKKGE